MSPRYASRPRVVFDCNIFLQALVNPNGPSGRCKQLVDGGQVELFVSDQIIEEIIAVLNRPRIRQLAPALTIGVIKAFIEDIRIKSIFLKNIPDEFVFERDPKDSCYINLALIANAMFLVSRDRDLLDLMEKTTSSAREFQSRYPHLRITDPSAFLFAVSNQP